MYDHARDPTVAPVSLDARHRMDFIKSFRRFVTGEMMPLNRVVFEHRIVPRFHARNNRVLESRREIRQEMTRDPYFQFYASLRRSGQELMYEAILDAIDSQKAADSSDDGEETAGGTLQLAPDFEMPTYLKAMDIHCMPGGYGRPGYGRSASTGLMFDFATNIYTMGMAGKMNDAFGLGMVDMIKRDYPDFDPANVLDMGCATGAPTVALANAFPSAKVTGIDASGALLRRAFDRSKKLGVAIDWRQQNAEATLFEDQSFDLITSHIMFHETSGRAIRAILKECHRLLRPGGIMVHLDMLSYGKMDPFTRFMFDNETYCNNEPFWANFRDLDQIDLAEKAGFDRGRVELKSFDNALAKQVQKTGKDTGKTGFQFLIGVK